MSDQFLAEIRIFPFNFAPIGWASCDGQLLSISQNTALFSLLGTQFGGDGKSNFGLPNLQGSVPVNFGQGQGLSPYSIGDFGGSQTVTLLQQEIPSHTHAWQVGTVPANVKAPTAGFSLTRSAGGNAYVSGSPADQFDPSVVAPVGGSQPHNNQMPYLVLNFCIALQGIYPSRS